MKIELLTGRQWMSILKWTLYGILFLFSILLQSSVLPRMPIGGICLSCVPACIACIALEEGAESGAVFALIAGCFFSLSGVSVGPLYILTLTLSAVISGGMSDRYCTKNIVSALLLGLISLAVCLIPAFLFRLYVGSVAGRYAVTVLIPEVFLSILTVPIFWLGSWAIGKIGR